MGAVWKVSETIGERKFEILISSFREAVRQMEYLIGEEIEDLKDVDYGYGYTWERDTLDGKHKVELKREEVYSTWQEV